MSTQLSLFELSDDQVISRALAVLESRLRYADASEVVQSPDSAKTLFRLRLADRPYEVFAVMFLDNRHRVIAYEEMSRGTIDSAAVHPREVVRQAIHHNAAAVIFAHNHPSGVSEPSQADRHITTRLREALALVDVRVVDHVIVGEEIFSFAERGLI